MGSQGGKSAPTLGFLTVLEEPRFGLFGGYLVLNAAARPVEFHCTAPIRPNRAQEILYGPTLEPFLYGEQIGRTLVEKAAAEPMVLCTDCVPVLAVREHVAMPVVLVLPSTDEKPSGDPRPADKFLRIDSAHTGGLAKMATFHIGSNRLAVPDPSGDDRRQIEERLARLGESLDLAEPFSRIRQAIEEAQQNVR